MQSRTNNTLGNFNANYGNDKDLLIYTSRDSKWICSIGMGEQFRNLQSNIDINRYVSNSLMLRPPPPPPVVVNCGQLRESYDGKYVEMTGRVTRKRMGRFAELRDGYGATQLVICEEKFPKLARRFVKIREESIITIIGEVVIRPDHSRNHSIATGDIEVFVEDIIKYVPQQATVTYKSNLPLKRSYNTMAANNYRGITSSEFKIATSENIIKYFDNRDMTCNDLRFADVGNKVQLVGWIPASNNSKFLQLKDGYGQTQIVVEDEALKKVIKSTRGNAVYMVKGHVLARPKANINVKYDTGDIEVFVEEIKVLDPAEPYQGPIKRKSKHFEKDSENVENEADENLEMEDKNIINKFTCRTHNCGELTISNAGNEVVLCGWLEFQRMKKFVVLRDAYGKIQITIPEKLAEEIKIDKISFESILKVKGIIQPRPDQMRNPQMATGDIEVLAASIEVLNVAKSTLPIEVREFNRSKEALRLTHRYIDLRSPDMQRNLRMRSDVIMKMREYLINRAGFIEVETPTLFRKTPGGAQEFIVPTQKAGHFYSLVQSPQQFKQMLMAGAIDRYFQVARCYRDEATRPDRQPEFTQLDIELSFTDMDGIMSLVEEILVHCWPKQFRPIKVPFPRMTYTNAMETYGTDKPDTRFEYTMKNISDILKQFDEFSSDENYGGYAIVVDKIATDIPNKVLADVQDISKASKCKFILSQVKSSPAEWTKVTLGKIFNEDLAIKISEELELKPESLVLLTHGDNLEAQSLLGAVRLALYERLENLNLVEKRRDQYDFLWITDFPMFAKDNITKNLESVHHPFTAPHEDDLELLKNKSNLTNIRSQAYDLVLNGQEIGGGSIRIHDYSLQLLVLDEILQIEHQHLQHLLEALLSGCPPHGGIALGLDRLISILCKTNSIRDVIAFPKGAQGQDHMSMAPVQISEEDKNLYSIEVKVKSEDSSK